MKSLLNNKFYRLLIRICWISIVGIFTMQLIVFLLEGKSEILNITLKDYFIVSLAFNLIAEIQINFDRVIDKFIPVPEKINLRFLAHLVFGTIVFILIFLLFRKSYSLEIYRANLPEMYFGFLLSMLFINGIVTYLILKRFIAQLIDSQQTISDIKQEKLMMSYNSLKDQLNPHYLFNNLSVLRALIHTDQKAASQFIEDFAEVYRYVLESNDNQLVPLAEEIDFIHAYLDLHKIRLKEGIVIKNEIKKQDLDLKIAPLTLQLLVENAIKHNIASKSSPLVLQIATLNKKIVVTNNLQKRTSTYSTNMGLKNLTKRYELICKEPVQVEELNNIFKVSVPLL